MPTFNYVVDGEPQTTSERDLTPNIVMKNAGIDANKNYLEQIEGDHQISYKDKGNDPIHMHDNMKFVSIPVGGPIPVS